MNGIQVGQSLHMINGAKFAEVDLFGSKIEKGLQLNDSTFAKSLLMDNLKVGEDVLLMNIDGLILNGIDLSFSEIGRNLIISGNDFPSLELTDTRIRGEINLGQETSAPLKWRYGTKLVLRNTEVAALQDASGAWPNQLDLNGFTYTHLGGIGAGGINDIAAREVSFFIDWLKKQEKYSPQPYEQLASVLKKEGYKVKAEIILYESRNRERKERLMGLEWLKSFFIWVFIGYGYYSILFVAIWTIIFTVLGVSILNYSGQCQSKGIKAFGFFYSFHMFLPFINISESYNKIDLDGYALYYFYFHKFVGYILALYLIAGLTGLVDR
jgi:hypothetical protein